MHKIILIGVFCIFCTATTLIAAESDSSNEKIKKRLQEFTDAVNQHRGDILSSFWTQDASLTNPVTGETYKGKEQIDVYLKKRNQEIQERQLNFTFTPTKIAFPAPHQAIVEGVLEIKDKGQLIRRNARKFGFVEQNGQWYINELREVEAAPAPPVYSQLKDLEWLIGNWKDADQDVTITFTNNWDKFKNFIIQHFKMETYGTETIEGLQIIGWDPIQKHIRSWVYDSDGGFGDGVWTKQNGGWQVALKYVLSDGSEGTATNIYSDITDRSYKYTSTARTINGESLDNIQPVTVKKE